VPPNVDARIQAQWKQIEKELRSLSGRISGLEKEVYARRAGSAAFSARSLEVSFREIQVRLEKLYFTLGIIDIINAKENVK